jgi:hypothetical protein
VLCMSLRWNFVYSQNRETAAAFAGHWVSCEVPYIASLDSVAAPPPPPAPCFSVELPTCSMVRSLRVRRNRDRKR